MLGKWIQWMVPMIWAGTAAAAAAVSLSRYEARRKPYQLARLAALACERHDRYGIRDSRGLLRAAVILNKGIEQLVPEGYVWLGLDRMLLAMGSVAAGRDVFIQGLLQGLAGALPLLTVPVLTKQWGWFILYPIGSVMLLVQRLRRIHSEFKIWQQQLTRDIPDVIDHLRINFAGGRDYLSALSQAGSHCGPVMALALEHLVNDIHTMGPSEALRVFSDRFNLPIMSKLAAAVRIAVESGYGAAETYFANIEDEILALRQEAAESLIQAKPGKLIPFYLILYGLAIAALGLKCYEIFLQVSMLFV
jgi:hypothetical protein